MRSLLFSAPLSALRFSAATPKAFRNEVDHTAPHRTGRTSWSHRSRVNGAGRTFQFSTVRRRHTHTHNTVPFPLAHFLLLYTFVLYFLYCVVLYCTAEGPNARLKDNSLAHVKSHVCGAALFASARTTVQKTCIRVLRCIRCTHHLIAVSEDW